jgi:hypothetical protein
MAHKPLDEYMESLPHLSELRERLAKNLRERELLRKLVRLVEQKERARAGQGQPREAAR